MSTLKELGNDFRVGINLAAGEKRNIRNGLTAPLNLDNQQLWLDHLGFSMTIVAFFVKLFSLPGNLQFHCEYCA